MTDYVYTSGGFPSSPTSGDSLVINGAYYDWTGGAWKIRNATPLRSEFIATANQATKTGLTYFVGSIDCYINGAKMLLGTDFTATNGTSVTFTPALDLDDEVQLIMGVSASSSGSGGVVTGTTLPSPVSAVGSLFLKTDDTDLYFSNGTDWELLVSTVPGSPAVANGGTETTVGGYKIHTFTSSGTFTVTTAGIVEYLVVAGGGSGGAQNAAGGGAGGFKTASAVPVTVQPYAITVGAGGANSTGTARGFTGSDSVFSNVTSLGGGGGGSDAVNDGLNGGSGGGANQSGGYGQGTSGQGTAGGSGGSNRGGGGGGSSSIGGSSDSQDAGDGGDGTVSSIDGTPWYYSGGGGGATYPNGAGGDGGAGGGGGGSSSSGTGGTGGSGRNAGGNGSGTDGNPGNGGANTGGGGGASRNTPTVGGAGGSGIVIVRYVA
jgi:hypothetical protein